MISLTLLEIANITNGCLIGKNIFINSISINSQSIPKNCLFIALKGKYFDSHYFVYEAIINNTKAILVNKKFNILIPQILVKNTKNSLSKLASWIRNHTKTRVIAITGSSGKTSVKEMTTNILNTSGYTLSTKKNLNNNIGVILTLLALKEQKYAVLEVGGNYHNEISYSSNIIKPESALVNNITFAHLKGFRSIRGVMFAKGEIFEGLLKNGTAVINWKSHAFLYWKKILKNKKIIYFNNKNNFWAKNIVFHNFYTKFDLCTPDGTIKIKFPLLGQHNISNALASAALAFSIDIPLKNIQEGLCNFKPIRGRLFPILLNKFQMILDDTYNANVGSIFAGIKVLSTISGYRVMVISDIQELGKRKNRLHFYIGKIAYLMKLNKVLTYGYLSQNITIGSRIGEHFQKKYFLIKRLLELISKHKKITILIKGSRIFKMEKIIKILLEKLNVNYIF